MKRLFGPRGPEARTAFRSSALHAPAPRHRPDSPLAGAAWRVTQRIAAAGALVGLAPGFLAVAAAIKATSKGPVLFRQQRRGEGGQPFTVYKFRTLFVGEERSSALGVNRSSSKITPIGKLLRELKIDELPQLLNVAKGDMALVGPRPIPIALEDHLRGLIEGFEERVAVRPGLTNVAQVALSDNKLGDQLEADWRDRFEAELHYIRNRGLSYDLVVMALTGLFVARRAGAKLLEELGAPTPPSEPHAQEVESTEVLGVPISHLDYEGVIAQLAEWIERGAQRYVAVVPVHSLMDAVGSEGHQRSLRQASLTTADGVPIAWALRLLGRAEASRVYGPDLMLATLAEAERRGWRMAFYGGSPERLELLLDRLAVQFPRLQVVEAISPPFRPLTPEEDADYCTRLREAQPDVTWVGIGSPRQEAWMRDRSARLPGVLIGVGAAFDFHAGAVRQAPAALQRVGLEWAFRLACEPRRLFWRYASANPRFLLFFALQLARAALAEDEARAAPRPEPATQAAPRRAA